MRIIIQRLFESFVNSERCKTVINDTHVVKRFESFVNSERCKTMERGIFMDC